MEETGAGGDVMANPPMVLQALDRGPAREPENREFPDPRGVAPGRDRGRASCSSRSLPKASSKRLVKAWSAQPLFREGEPREREGTRRDRLALAKNPRRL